MGRFEPAGPRRTGRSRPEVAHWQHGGLLSHTLLTLMAALNAALEVGLVALTRRRPSGGDRLLTLQSRLSLVSQRPLAQQHEALIDDV